MKKLIEMTDDQLLKLEKTAFNSFGGDEDNFDPDNFDPDNFDPDNATGKVKLGSLAQFTLAVVNNLGASAVLEMFQHQRSVAFINNPNISAFNPFTALDVAAANANSLIYFDRSGNLVYQDAGGLKLTLSCKQLPYRSMFVSSANTPFKVERIRMTVTNDGQIDNDIIHVKNTFLGKVERNAISPRAFFAPNQFQSKVVDITSGFTINAESGIETTVASGETGLTYNLYLRSYAKGGRF